MQFFAVFPDTQKKDGEDYKLKTTATMDNIIQDKIIKTSREAFESKRKQWRLLGKGGHPNKALGLTNHALEKFWSEKQLKDQSPEALLDTVLLNNTM